MTVNAGPDALASRARRAARGRPGVRIVVELTEHAAVEDYPVLAAALGGLRAGGVRLAIDDAGAGFASLMHILRLAPDFIKLDRQLIWGLDLDPVRRSLAASLMRFAEESGASIVPRESRRPGNSGSSTARGEPRTGLPPRPPRALPEITRPGARASRPGPPRPRQATRKAARRARRAARLERTSTTTGAWSEGFVPLRASRSM